MGMDQFLLTVGTAVAGATHRALRKLPHRQGCVKFFSIDRAGYPAGRPFTRTRMRSARDTRCVSWHLLGISAWRKRRRTTVSVGDGLEQVRGILARAAELRGPTLTVTVRELRGQRHVGQGQGRDAQA